MTRFGSIIPADVLEDDLTSYLQKWFKTYAAEVSEQVNGQRGLYPEPKYWTTAPIVALESESQIRYPAVLVVSPGLLQKPVRHGDGSYEGTYQIGVCIITTARKEIEAGRMARRYGAAIHTAVMQHQSLDTTYIEGIEWADERFTDFLSAEQETCASATEIFNITVKGLFNMFGGPGVANPLPEPAVYPENPSVVDPDAAPPYSPIHINP